MWRAISSPYFSISDCKPHQSAAMDLRIMTLCSLPAIGFTDRDGWVFNGKAIHQQKYDLNSLKSSTNQSVPVTDASL
jgi:hypothetical protein